MICEEVEKKILALADGTLPEAEKEMLAAHIYKCARCETFVELIKVVDGTHSLGSSEFSPQFWPKLYQRIREYDASQAELRSRSAAIKLWLRPLLDSTCLVLGLWAGIVFGSAVSVRLSAQELHKKSITEESSAYWEILGGFSPGSLSELFTEQYSDERTKP
jgi:anti-sigma factor RsiW